MKFVAEAIIDGMIEQLEQQEQEAKIIQLEETQPAVLAYLLSENFQSFSEKERDYLFFLSLVVCLSVRSLHPTTDPISEAQIDKAEVLNWDKLEGIKEKKLRDRWTPFFTDYPQEDLLAFVEDALEIDEEQEMSREVREIIFISMKSLIDALINAN
ncbi:MAG: hypothetical protein AAF985_02545 [Bacteroidota bacterium]